MSYRVHCDWCGTHLGHDDDRAVMPVTFERARSTKHGPWAQEVKVTRHFCITPESDDLDRWGRNRMGLVPDEDDAESCYERAIQTMTGKDLRDPGMGLEWRLVAVPGGPSDEPPPPVDDAFQRMLDTLPVSCRNVLPRAGITTFERVAAMSDEELLAVDRVGPAVLKALRAAIAERERVA